MKKRHYRFSRVDYQSILEMALELLEFTEPLPQFITVDGDKKLMKTFMATYSAKKLYVLKN